VRPNAYAVAPRATSTCERPPLTRFVDRWGALAFALAVVLAALLAAAPATWARPEPPPYVEVHVLDVGQADATLIFGTGGQVVLYDTGRNRDDVPEALARIGVDALDLLVLSHQHADHIGGAAAVLGLVPVRFVLWNELPATTQVHERTIAAMAAADVETLAPVRRRIGLGEAALHVLPPTGDGSFDQDGNMVGLVIEHGAFRMVVAGDAYPVQWAAWLAEHPDLLAPVTALRASHHGSRTGDTDESLAALRPEVVIVSVGASNPYEHPHPEALARYRRHAATILRTDERGTIVVRGWADGRYEIVTDR
jgi:competence protein ComEC